MGDKLSPKSNRHKGERSLKEWQEYQRTRDTDEKRDLDLKYLKRENSRCQADGCQNEPVHHDKRENKSGKCLSHWEGDSDDNG